MVPTMEPVLQIEAPRNHSLETLERLRKLLDSGAPARPDPKRLDFFEIDGETQVFYVHVAKDIGKVTLLAVWDREAGPVATRAETPA
jgi:hypothetical protein